MTETDGVFDQLPEPERALLQSAMHDPVVWGETVLTNRDGSPRRYWPHQVADLRCPARNIIHRDGRDAGKTCVLSTHALHFATSYPGVSGLIAAPHQGHLDSIIEEMEFQLQTSDLLREILALTQDYPQIVGTFPFCFSDYRDPSKVHNGYWNEVNLKGLVDYHRNRKLAFQSVKAIYS